MRVLAVTLANLRHVGATCHDPAKASIAVVTNAPGSEDLRRPPALVDAGLNTL
jgi:hypothetical protein